MKSCIPLLAKNLMSMVSTKPSSALRTQVLTCSSRMKIIVIIVCLIMLSGCAAHQRSKLLTSGSISELEEFYYHNPADIEAKNRLLALYENDGTYDSYIAAFGLSKKHHYLQQAYNKADTPAEKQSAEKIIVQALPFEQLFEIVVTDRNDSPVRSASNSGVFHTVKAQVKDIERTITVSARADSPFPIRYADYQITVHFTERLKFAPPLLGPEKDILKRTLTFQLNAANEWSHQQSLVFNGVPVYGTYRPAGVGALGFLSGLIGGPKVSLDEFDIDFALRDSQLDYKVGELK